MATVAHPRLEPGEFRALQAGAGWRLAAEFIDGQAVVMPPAGGHAASVQGELFYALRRWQATSGDAGLLLQDIFVQMPDEQYLAPDIAWWAAERRPPLRDGALATVPDLVAEVLSPATRANDLGAKRELYLRAGVRELWFADPTSATITRVSPGAADEPLAGRAAVLTSRLLRGFTVETAQLFRG